MPWRQEGHSVQVFSAVGEFLMKRGTDRSGDGQFRHPEDIAVDDSGKVYVVDRGNSRAQVFKTEIPAP